MASSRKHSAPLGNASLGNAFRENAFLEEVAAAIKCLPEAVVIWDEQDRLLFWNERYCELCPVVADMMQPGVYFPDIVWESLQRQQFIIHESPQEWYARRLEFHHRCEGYMEQQLVG